MKEVFVDFTEFFVQLPISVKEFLGILHTSIFNIFLFKVDNKNTRKRCEIRSKLTIKTPK